MKAKRYIVTRRIVITDRVEVCGFGEEDAKNLAVDEPVVRPTKCDSIEAVSVIEAEDEEG